MYKRQISASLSAGARASDRSTAVGATAFDAPSTTTGLGAPSGLGFPLPANNDAYVRAAGAQVAWLPPAPPPPLYHRGTVLVLPASVFTPKLAKTDALVVSLATPLAIAAPPFADIAPFLVRNVMNDSLT